MSSYARALAVVAAATTGADALTTFTPMQSSYEATVPAVVATVSVTTSAEITTGFNIQFDLPQDSCGGGCTTTCVLSKPRFIIATNKADATTDALKLTGDTGVAQTRKCTVPALVKLTPGTTITFTVEGIVNGAAQIEMEKTAKVTDTGGADLTGAALTAEPIIKRNWAAILTNTGATAAVSKDFRFTRSSDVAGAKDVAVGVTFKPTAVIPEHGYVVITVPAGSTNLAAAKCSSSTAATWTTTYPGNGLDVTCTVKTGTLAKDVEHTVFVSGITNDAQSFTTSVAKFQTTANYKATDQAGKWNTLNHETGFRGSTNWAPIVTKFAGLGVQGIPTRAQLIATDAASTSIGAAEGLAFDSVGNLYVTTGKAGSGNGQYHQILRFDSRGADRYGPATTARVFAGNDKGGNDIPRKCISGTFLKAGTVADGAINELTSYYAGTGFSEDRFLQASDAPRGDTLSCHRLNAFFSNPTSLAFNQYNLFFADTDNHCIRKIDMVTNMVTCFAGNCLEGGEGTAGVADGAGIATATFTNPDKITFDLDNNMYVVDHAAAGGKVRMITSLGVVSTLADTSATDFGAVGAVKGFTAYVGATTAMQGFIFFTLNDIIYQRDTTLTTQVIKQITVGTCSTGTSKAHGLVIDSDDNLWYSDSAQDVIGRVFLGSSTPAAIAEVGTCKDSNADFTTGTDSTAKLSGPTALVLDNDGNLLVADVAGATSTVIRKVTGL